MRRKKTQSVSNDRYRVRKSISEFSLTVVVLLSPSLFPFHFSDKNKLKKYKQ